MKAVVDLIGNVVASMRAPSSESPYYMYGHRLEIARELVKLEKNPAKKNKKYPLIALRMDFPEDMVPLRMATLNIAILDYTQRQYTAAERYANVIKPILYPLYDSFMLALKNSFVFSPPDKAEGFPHRKVDRPFWGIGEKEGYVKNIFDDPLDAVELVDLKLVITSKC